MIGTPLAEVEIDTLLVSQLLAEQHLDLQNQAIQFVADHTHYLITLAATLARAKGWAILFGIVLLESGLVGHSQHDVIGQKILQCVAQSQVSP